MGTDGDFRFEEATDAIVSLITLSLNSPERLVADAEDIWECIHTDPKFAEAVVAGLLGATSALFVAMEMGTGRDKREIWAGLAVVLQGG